MKTKSTTRARKAERDYVYSDLSEEFECIAISDYDVIDEVAYSELEDE